MQSKALLAVSALLLLTPAAALAQHQNPAQQRCISEMNEAVARVAQAQGRAAAVCVSVAQRGKLPLGSTAQSCLSLDPRGKVSKARLRLVQAQSLYCATLPDFGFTDAASAGEAVLEQEVDTYARLFGDSLDAAIVPVSADSDRGRCQTLVVKAIAKMEQLQFRAFTACKTAGMRNNTISGEDGLEACLAEMEDESFRLVGKIAVKLLKVMDAACPSINLAAAFPGQCAGSTDFVDCVRKLSLCGVCLTANRTDILDAYCDELDDGTANASCVDVNRCGNGTREPGEGCDDGNEATGDCCAPDCTIEPAGNPCASDSNSCTDDRCNASGVCAHTANASGCSDGLFCNGTDQCAAGSCSAHTGNPCAAGSECNDQCHAAGHCFTDAGTPCTDDGAECTNDACDGSGTCAHPAVAAGTSCTADTNPCTNDVCDGEGACHHPPIPVGSPCQDDGNPCTSDLCDVSGACVHANLAAGAPCGDHTVTSCSGADTCNGAGVCQNNHAAAGAPCDNDSNVCTDDVCSGAGACQHSNNTAPCDDGLFCNGDDTCAAGSCSVHGTDPCPGGDGGDCSESCNEDENDCSAADPNGSACTDSLFCNGADSCLAGVCSGHAGDPCPGPDGDGNCSENCNETARECNAAEANGSPCDDGLYCNGADTCLSGACSVHPGNPCAGVDGDNDCAETCSEALSACGPDPNGSACNDGIFCNGTDTCADGTCQSHSGDPCTGPDGDGNCSEQCNEAADECNAPDPDGAQCNDGQGCNGMDNCLAGVCTGAGVCCGTVDFTFTINSSAGGAFNAAMWPGGTVSQTSQSGCDVTIRRPSGRLDTVGSTGDNFGVTAFSGFAACVGTGGEDGDGCQPVSCPPAGIGQCASTRPSCSAALNGSGSSRYFVRCTDP